MVFLLSAVTTGMYQCGTNKRLFILSNQENVPFILIAEKVLILSVEPQSARETWRKILEVYLNFIFRVFVHE